MKRTLLTRAWTMLLLSFTAISMMAQTITVNVTQEGGLWDALEAQNVSNFSAIKSLKVTGAMGTSDFLLIKNQMPNLESVDISGTNVTEIPEKSFYQKEKLSTVRLPEEITYIRREAFKNCQQLTSLTFGTQSTVTGKIAFSSSLRYVEYNAFSECQKLTHIDFSACSKLETLGGDAFRNLYNLKEVIFPSQGNLRIEWTCFYVDSYWDEATQQWINKGLENLTLTKAVTSFSNDCFPRTLKTLYVESSTPPSCEENAFNPILDNETVSIKVYVPKGSKRNYAVANGWSRLYQYMQETGIQLAVSGYGSVLKGNRTYTDGDVIFVNTDGSTTLKAKPELGCELISVKLNGNSVSVATDGTFTIPAGTSIGTLDLAYTANPMTVNNPNGGELKDNIAAMGTNPNTIRALKVVGTMTTKDWNYIKNLLTALVDFDISETDVETIPEQAFQDNQMIKAIHLPSTVTIIDRYAFQNCQNLTTVDGCENVKIIRDRSFNNCPKLANFPFGDKLQSIESAAFENCSSLPESLVMPASLNSFGWDNMFNGSSVRSFDLSQCTLNSSFGYDAFGQCTSLQLPAKGDYSLSDYALNNAQITELRLPAAVSQLWGERVLPATLKHLYVSRTTPYSVSDNAFNNIDFEKCTLYVPAGSSDAYEEAAYWSNFYNVKELGFKIIISGFGSVKQGNIAYSNGDAYMPTQNNTASLTAVPEQGCQLLSVTINGNAVSVDANGNFALPEGTATGTIEVVFSINETIVDNPDGGGLKDMIAAQGSNARTIRALKVVGKMNNKDWSYVKSNMSSLEVFDISETDVKTIPESAFQNHQTLTTVHLPSTIVSISNNAFWDCPQLTTVDGCENVKEIGSGAFGYCRQLLNFPFGNAIRSIESSAFTNCTSLPETLVMPASLNTLGWSDVFNGSSIQSFDLSQCTMNGNFAYNAFGKCTSLQLPEKGDYQMYNNALKEAELTELRLPAAISHMGGDNVLPTTLERLYVSRSEPFSVDNNTFKNIDTDQCTLYVPIGATEAYANAEYWSDFTKVKEYGMQVTIGEQGKVRSGAQTLMGKTTFFPKGSIATFEIVPNAGWHTAAVTLDGVDIPFTNNLFTLNGDQLGGKLAVAFAANQFNLQLQIAGSGQVKLGSLVYTENQTLTVDSLSTLNFTLVPAEGSVVSDISFNGKESVVQNGGTTYVTPAITANATLAITFGTAGATGDFATYTVSTGEGGTVEYKNTTLLEETTIQLPKGQETVFTIKPEQYFIVDVVKLNGENITSELDAEGNLTVKDINADANLEITFRVMAEIAVVMEDGGNLTNMLTDKQKQNVTKLTIKGRMYEQDFYTMRDEMPQLTEIDLWEAETDYIPSQAFCTNADWSSALGHKSLTRVRLPEGTHNIGWFAFAGCSNLKEVNFAELKELDYMSTRCFAQTSINIVNLSNTKLTELSDQFYQVKNLESFIFPQTLNRLGDVFRESALTEIDLSKCTNLKTLDGTFNECKKLVKVTLPEGLTNINSAFGNCESLTTINFPKSLQNIGGSSFQNTKLQKIDLSGLTELQNIGEYAFQSCHDLTTIALPEGLTTINYNTFNECTSLTAINFPKSLQNIGSWAFQNTKLQKVDLSGLTELQNIGEYAFHNCQELTEVLFPTSLTQLGNGVFCYCRKLTSIDLSNTQLLSIPERTFDGCEALESFKLPQTLETIGNSAFAWNNKLGGVLELGPNFSRIGDEAFAGTQISIIRSEATVPPTLSNNSMPESWFAAFVPEGYADTYKDAAVWEDKIILDREVHADITVSNEGNLAVDIYQQAGVAPATVTHLKVHGPLGPQDFAIMRDNMTVLYDLDMEDAEVSVIPENAFNNVKKKVLMNVKLPASLLRIEQYAFYGCSGLDGSLVLPEGLKFIGWGAFQGCTSLDEVVLNKNLAVIQGYAFEGCSSLAQEITLPNDFESLGERAFANCSNLYGTVKFNRDFYMFMGTEGYGSSAGSCFANCSKIETVDMSEPDFLDEIPYSTFANCTSLKTVLLPPMLDRIDNCAFENCSSLDNIEFPNTLLVINSRAFQNCTSLSSVNLSECKDFGTIEGYAFNGCSNLETVYLPKSLNWINERAFADCSKLTNLTVEAVTPADLGDYVFNNVRTDRCVLSIPTGTYYDYLTAAQWGAFVSMRKNIDVTVGDGASLYFLNNGPIASARGMSRAVSDGQDGAKVKDGSSLYVQENETAIFKVNTDENAEITKVLFNGEDVTSEMVNGTYETPGVTDASSFEVQVKVTGALHVKELRLLDDDVTMKVGEKRQLKYAVYPTNATNKGVEWTSSNKNVATVNSDGIITGVAAGQAEITGKTIDGGIVEKLQIAIAPNKYWIVMDDKVTEDKVVGDRTIKLPLALHNEEEARDIQFDVWTPDGFYMDGWDIELSERANGYQITTENISNKVIRVKLYSENGKKFKDNDGELLKLTFNDYEKGGDFDVAIRNIHISGPDNVDCVAPNRTIHFSLIPFLLGDSNADGFVNAADIVNIVNNIKGSPMEKFNWKRSDANRDDTVNEADVKEIKDIIMGK